MLIDLENRDATGTAASGGDLDSGGEDTRHLSGLLTQGSEDQSISSNINALRNSPILSQRQPPPLTAAQSLLMRTKQAALGNTRNRWAKLGRDDDIDAGDSSEGEIAAKPKLGGWGGGGGGGSMFSGGLMLGGGTAGGGAIIGAKRLNASKRPLAGSGGGVGGGAGGALGFMKLGGGKPKSSQAMDGRAGQRKKAGVASRALDDFDDEFSMDASLGM